MSLLQEIMQRANSQCELCGSKDNLQEYEVTPNNGQAAENTVLTCATCYNQLTEETEIQPNHWRCLNDSMWSSVPAVQVVAYRMLHKLKAEGWPQDLLDMLYMEEDTKEWAKAGLETTEENANALEHRDSNGVKLEAGDNVVLIKDLPVKGSSMVAKRGTAVRRISLVHDNEEQIEGKVNGQQIVILTKFVKKT
ncbi:PhnA domain-containing protein [Haloflavibacter putidus]|uniref:PhnA protein n=1 Tax=Haloflavibacter putidus TaxID=2576776 RepID=A0A507ZT11_9FLAO|nr:alkylphosphonate utilization protein [Haloflavibacter putidus]TQD38858.1 PhnA protein [Haloflavibacter putidus]